MESKKGNGVFLGVVAVATLIVAIIGATFAYFSITAQSAENAVNLSAYDTATTLEVEPVELDAVGELIPLDSGALIGTAPNQKTYLEYAITDAGTDNNVDSYGKCVDSRGYQICALYKLTFINSSTSSIQFSGSIKATLNQASAKSGRSAFLVGDLKAQIVSDAWVLQGTAATIGEDQNLTAFVDPIAVGTDATEVSLGNITINDVNTNDGETEVYVVVWLEGTDDLDSNGNPIDQSSRMGATFEGQLTFQTGDGSMLTGTFNISGN